VHTSYRAAVGRSAPVRALATLSLALLLPASLHAAELPQVRVFTSAAPRAVLRHLEPVFERATGHRLAVEYDFSPELKRRIEAGDPFDVAILPPDVADGLAQRGRLVAASRVDLGRTGLGVAVRKDAPIPNIGTVDAFRSALLAAPTVAYADGGASSVRIRAILARLGIAEAMEGKLRPYPSGAAVAALARGEADLVLIGVTPILQVPAVTLAGRLPAELQTYIVFTGSIGTAAKEPQAARTLLDLLTSPEGIALFKAQGFEPAAGP
jgi:molybdate transport system substrate-binding protein